MSVQTEFATRFVPNASSPLVTRERFAEMVGLPLGVITGWCNKGLVPCVSVGKYSLINVALLGSRCVAKEFN
jgi:hypothetical protein